MCLLTFQKKEFVADKEMPVYKILGKDNFSPFASFLYKRGTNKPEGIRVIEHIGPNKNCKTIYGGFLHAFTNRLFAETHIGTFPGKKTRDKIVKMYVPVGAEYYISEDGTEICATAMVWKYPCRKIIEFFKKKND